MRVGLLASTGKHLDSFFPDIRLEMLRQGLEVYAAAGTPSHRMPCDRIHGMSQAPGLPSLVAPRALRSWAHQRRLDLVITNTATASALVRVAGLGVPIVYFCHGLHWNSGGRPSERVWQAIEKFLLRETSGIICMNSDDRDWFVENAADIPTTYFASGVGVPLEFIETPRTHASPDASLPLRLLWIGDFSKRKRPTLAVELAERLRAAGASFRLTMVGDGPLQQAVAQEVARAELQSAVTLAGRVDSVLQLIDDSQLFVHTSTWEGLPRVLLEGLARGRRAVAFDVKGVRDIPHASLIPDGDVNRMATAIIDLGRSGSLELPPLPSGTIKTSAEVGAQLAQFARSIPHD